MVDGAELSDDEDADLVAAVEGVVTEETGSEKFV